MTELAAMRAAIGLYHLPASVRLMRTEPLPQGIEPLLRIAAGDADVEARFAALLDRPGPLVRQAAEFFVEQVLLGPDSDHYRVLGASSAQASTQELRHNMALLMSWLHPDKHPGQQRTVFAGRVTAAWDTLRSAERRAAYDAGRRMATHTANGSGATAQGSKGRDGSHAAHWSGHAAHPGLRNTPGRGPSHPMNAPDGLLRRGLDFLRRVIRDHP